MKEVSDEKKKELYDLVEKQKKAKITWIGTITKISEEQIKTIAMDIGLVINEDLIMLPSETKVRKDELLKQKN